MMAGSHVAVGMAAWLWVAPHLGHTAADPAALALVAAGSLLPDLDHPKSWVGRRLPFISRPLSALVGHRGPTHSLLAIASCLILVQQHLMARSISLPLVIGYLSHLGADLLTPNGLRLAWPLRGSTALPLCKTGSPAEVAVVILLVGWTAARLLHFG